MPTRMLDEALHRKISMLCQQGDALAEQKQFEQAFYCYRDALNTVPEPPEEWEATT